MKGGLLVAEKLSCTAGQRQLFDGLDLVLRRGDLVEVRGPNGSGKSTLLRGLAGLRRWQSGRVERCGSIDYLGHKSGLGAFLTPLENIRYRQRLKGRHVDVNELATAMTRLGLRAARHERCAALSAGQRRRAALAALLVGGTDIWLLDEPLTELDEAGADTVRQLIAEHRDAGGAAVCATHVPLGSASGAPATVLDLGATA